MRLRLRFQLRSREEDRTRLAPSTVWLSVFALLICCEASVISRADEASPSPPKTAWKTTTNDPEHEIGGQTPATPHRLLRRDSDSAVNRQSHSTPNWIGTGGIVLALAVCGGLSLVFRKYVPAGASSALTVMGRVGLSPKHSVHLVRAGTRILLIGTGPQGAPSLLGQWTDEESSSSLASLADGWPAPTCAEPDDGSVEIEGKASQSPGRFQRARVAQLLRAKS
jgi:hypothetical protein